MVDSVLSVADCLIVSERERERESEAAWVAAARGSALVRLHGERERERERETERESVLSLSYGFWEEEATGDAQETLRRIRGRLASFAEQRGMRSRYLDEARALVGPTQMRLQLLQTFWAISQWGAR
jgi:hypothetical protein